jgi:hypothetical protein
MSRRKSTASVILFLGMKFVMKSFMNDLWDFLEKDETTSGKSVQRQYFTKIFLKLTFHFQHCSFYEMPNKLASYWLKLIFKWNYSGTKNFNLKFIEPAIEVNWSKPMCDLASYKKEKLFKKMWEEICMILQFTQHDLPSLPIFTFYIWVT